MSSAKLENLLVLSGGFGRYQWCVLLAVALPGIIFLWHNFGMVFGGAVPDHWCQLPSELRQANWTTQQLKMAAIPRKMQAGVETFDHCHMFQRNYSWLATLDPQELDLANLSTSPIVQCEKWEFDTSIYSSTVATEWELVCGRLTLLSTLQTIYMGGVLVGSLFFGSFSDKFGRRKTILLATMFTVVGSMSSAMAPNYASLAVLRFLVGAGIVGMYACAFVLVAEMSPTEHRTVSTFVFDIFTALGRATVGVVAYFFRDWRHLLWAFALPSLIFLPFFWVLPDSIRWLLVKGRFKEAERVLRTAAKINGKELPSSKEMRSMMESLRETELEEEESFTEHHKEEDEEVIPRAERRNDPWWRWWKWNKCVVFVRSREMRRRSLPMLFSWFTLCFVTQGLAFHFVQLPFSANLAHVINGSALLLARLLLVFWPLPDILGRRKCYCSCFLIGGLAAMVIPVLPSDWKWLTVTLTLSSSIFVTLAFTLAFLYTAELFPTEVRNAAIGLGSLSARLGGMAAPFVVDLGVLYHPAVPSAIFGVFSTSAGVLCLLLPETRGKSLPETMIQMEENDLR